jgi:hypothetical protein
MVLIALLGSNKKYYRGSARDRDACPEWPVALTHFK